MCVNWAHILERVVLWSDDAFVNLFSLLSHWLNLLEFHVAMLSLCYNFANLICFFFFFFSVILFSMCVIWVTGA